MTEVESFLQKEDKALEKECERMENVNEEMDKELKRKEAKKLELERRVQEAEEKRKLVEAKYEASLQEQIRMQMRIRDILSDKIDQLAEKNNEPEDGSTTTEEWNFDKEDKEP